MSDRANQIATWLGIIGVIAGMIFAGGQLKNELAELQTQSDGNRAVIARALQNTTDQETIDYLRHIWAHICADMREKDRECTLPSPDITPPITVTPDEINGRD